MTLSDFMKYVGYAQKVIAVAAFTVQVVSSVANADPNQPELPMPELEPLPKP